MVNVTRESDSPTEVTLTISMEPGDLEPFLNRSYRRVVSRLQIPGFRPGKAPRSVVENHVGRVALVQEALEFMIPESLDQVLREQDIKAFSDPDLEVLELEPVSFKAVVPLEPEVDLGEISALSVERPEVEISQEDVDQVLEELRYEAAPWEPVERPVAFGDLVTLNVKGNIAGEQVVDDEGIDFIPQQDNEQPLPGFSIYLEGMTEGQDKEFTLAVPDDYPQQSYAGLECRFQVDVISIKEKQLPELDDEFAKGVRDGYESLEALSTSIRERLTESAEYTAQRQLEQSILEELRNQATIQASSLIYQRELDSMYDDRERSLRNQRLNMDTYLEYMGQTAEELREQLRPQAEERLHTFLVIRKFADQEGIEVGPEEVDEEIDRLISFSATESEGPMRQALNTDSSRDSIRTNLLQRKTTARLAEIVGVGASEDLAQDTATEDTGTAEQTGPADTDEEENVIDDPVIDDPVVDDPVVDDPVVDDQENGEDEAGNDVPAADDTADTPAEPTN